MMDFGLLMSALVVVAAVVLVERLWPLQTVEPGQSFLDVIAWPTAIGLLAGRTATLLIDNPDSLRRIRDVLIIRSGVEFWPGVFAAALVAAFAARRVDVDGWDRLADLAPLVLVGYGAYEASCIFREGCYGPVASIGLQPRGIAETMVPVGIFMGCAAIVSAGAVRRRRNHWNSRATTALAVAVLALIRAMGSIWLPHIGSAPTRQHVTSVVVAVLAGFVLALLVSAPQRARTTWTGA